VLALIALLDGAFLEGLFEDGNNLNNCLTYCGSSTSCEIDHFREMYL